MDWTITDDDKKLSQIADKALHEHRQRIQTDEGVVVLISQEELDQIEGRTQSLGEYSLSTPKADVGDDGDTLGDHILRFPKVEEADFSRDRSPDREFEW